MESLVPPCSYVAQKYFHSGKRAHSKSDPGTNKVFGFSPPNRCCGLFRYFMKSKVLIAESPFGLMLVFLIRL